MERTDIAAYFENKGVKPTANRVLVLRSLQQICHPVCLADLETELDTMDKSSISRVLALFLNHDIVHTFEDGRGVLHYELCGRQGVCNHSDEHVHFYCEICRLSFCMEELRIPKFNLPKGFEAHSASFVIKGVCPKCKMQKNK